MTTTKRTTILLLLLVTTTATVRATLMSEAQLLLKNKRLAKYRVWASTGPMGALTYGKAHLDHCIPNTEQYCPDGAEDAEDCDPLGECKPAPWASWGLEPVNAPAEDAPKKCAFCPHCKGGAGGAAGFASRCKGDANTVGAVVCGPRSLCEYVPAVGSTPARCEKRADLQTDTADCASVQSPSSEACRAQGGEPADNAAGAAASEFLTSRGITECSTTGWHESWGCKDTETVNGTTRCTESSPCAPVSDLHLDDFEAYDFWTDTYEKLAERDAAQLFPHNLRGEFYLRPTACASLVYGPHNTGSFVSDGGPQTHVVVINVQNKASEPYGLTYKGGATTVVGGSNEGTAPISFETTGAVSLHGLENRGEVVFTRSQDIFLGSTTNRAGGRVTFDHVEVSAIDVVNEEGATVSVLGGRAFIAGTTNAGTIVASDADATIRAEGNAGTVVAMGGTYDIVASWNRGSVTVGGGATVSAVLVRNEGAITIADGVAGSLLVVGENTGTIKAPPAGGNFTLETAGFNAQVLTQTLTLGGGVCPADLDAHAQRALRTAVAGVCGVETWRVVLRTVAAAAGCGGGRRRRLGASGRRRELNGDEGSTAVTYDVVFTQKDDAAAMDAVAVQMKAVKGAPSLVSALQAATGKPALSAAAASDPEPKAFSGYANAPPSDGGGDGDGDGDGNGGGGGGGQKDGAEARRAPALGLVVGAIAALVSVLQGELSC